MAIIKVKPLADIAVLYEDDNCVVLNKPAGLMVHSDGRNEGPFLTDWIEKHYPETMTVGETARGLDGEPIARGGIIHRLDRETSGALIVAKTQAGFLSLKSQFQNHEIKKKYLAFVWGEIKENFGTINRPIGRSKSDFRKWSSERGARGLMREAETYWTNVWVDKDPENNEKLTLIEAEPKTGRTHQIRVHFKAFGHPIVGDPLYAPNRPRALSFARLALHSWKISFKDLNEKVVSIVAPLPKDFAHAVKECGIKGIK